MFERRVRSSATTVRLRVKMLWVATPSEVTTTATPVSADSQISWMWRKVCESPEGAIASAKLLDRPPRSRVV